MATTFQLDAEMRRDSGKGANRRLRRAGRIPAILYGGEHGPVSLQVEGRTLSRYLEHEAFYSSSIELRIDGRSERVVLKDLQRHPSRPTVLHLDLLRFRETERLRMRVPLHFVGGEVSPAVKGGAGIETHHLTEVEVSCLGKDLPEFINVDLSRLQLGEVVHLSDVQLPEGVELVELSHGAERDLVVGGILPKKADVGVSGGEGGAAAEGVVE